MAGPWDRYVQAAAPAAGVTAAAPWTKYAPAQEMLGGAPAPEPSASLFRMDSDFRERAPNVGMGDMAWAATRDMFGSRQGAAEYLAKEAGGTVAQSPEGDPLVQLGDGTQYRMNDPGIDSTDIANFAGNALAFLTPAGMAARYAKASGLGLGGRMALQGGAAGATDAGLQLGTEQTIDPLRSALTVAGGGAGEALGTLGGTIVNKIREGSRNAPAANLAAADELLQSQGLGGTPDLAAKIAPQMQQIAAGADQNAILGQGQYGFQYTLGQRMTEPAQKFAQLSQEETLRQSPGGFAAFDALRTNNASALDNALTKMGEKFGAKAATTPAEMVQGAQTNLQRQASTLDNQIGAAYAKAGEGARAAVGTDAIKALPERMKAAVQDFGIDPELTPASFRTLSQISKEAGGIAEAIEGGKVTGVTLKALETQRRILNNRIGSAANPTDKAAMVGLKREFDSWLDEAVDSALVTGDESALAAIKEARTLRAEFGKRFEGKGDTDKFIEGLVSGTRTPEELMNIAMGASQVSKASGARFIERLRTAAQDDPEIMGGLRAAHLSRLTRGNNGEPVQMGQMVRNIRSTEFSNNSVVRALYSPEEWAEVRRLADALEPMLAKGDFAKSSGTAERMARMLATRVGGGFVGDALSGITGLLQGGKAQRAITAPVKGKSVPTPSGPNAPSGMAAILQSLAGDDPEATPQMPPRISGIPQKKQSFPG